MSAESKSKSSSKPRVRLREVYDIEGKRLELWECKLGLFLTLGYSAEAAYESFVSTRNEYGYA